MVQPLSVDSSQTVIFPCLASGGTLHVISEETAIDPQALGAYFSRVPIDVLKIAPSHLAALWQGSSQAQQLLPRRQLIVGGESSRPEWIAQLQAKARCAIINHYGPTEATVATLTFAITNAATRSPRRRCRSGGRCRIPRPTCSIVACSRSRSESPGSSISAGAASRAGISTGPRRAPRSSSRIRSATGPAHGFTRPETSCAITPTATSSFIGRTDHQVKIRGFRVEPAEIASVLCGHPAVRDSVVMARDDRRGDRQLVAYVVPPPGHEAPAIELRRFLAAKLPAYMVPASFVVLDALPLTPHGKVDLGALPAPVQPRRSRIAPGRAAHVHRGDSRRHLGGSARAGAGAASHDSFLDLGGHSLLFTQVAARIRGALRVELPLRDLFANPTLADMARRIDEARRDGRATPVRPLLPLAREQRSSALLSPSSGCGSWTSSIPRARSTTFRGRMRIRGAAARRGAGGQPRRDRPAARSAAHDVSASQWCSDASCVSPSAHPALAIVNLAGHPESEREAAAIELAADDAQRPFDLARGPLLRPILFQLADDDFVFSYAMHHIVSDAWSQRIFLRELSVALRGSRRGRAVAPAAARRAVPGLRGLAARLAPGRGVGAATRLLEGPAARRPRAAAAHRSSAPRAPELPWREAAVHVAACPVGLAAQAWPQRGCDAVHDAARGLPGPAAPLHGTGRHRGGVADRRAVPARNRRPDRVLPQHPGVSRRPLRRSGLRGAARTGEGNGLGRLRAPGRAVRKARRGTAAAARSRPLAAVPGAVRPSGHRSGRSSPRRASQRARSNWTPRRRSST